MAGEALRSLTAEVGFDIDYGPLRRLDRALDELRDRLIHGGLDRFNRDLHDAERNTERLERELEEARRDMDRLGRAAHESGSRFTRFGQTANRALQSVSNRMRSVGGSMLRAPFSLPGMIAGGGAAFGIGALAKESIGGAAQLELQSLQLEALMKDSDKAKKLFESMNAKGMKSSFSEADFLEGAKTFLPLTKDLKQIDKLTELQERMGASNPMEGMAGAAFSIREALSGDTVSLAERFNVPKSMLGNLKKATSMTGKIEALDKILTDMGYTQEYLNKVNESAAAQWDNLGSNIKMNFARAGEKALEELKPFLKDMNQFLASDRAGRMFDSWGRGLAKLAREARDFGRWLIDAGGKAFDYLDRNYFSNDKFQQLPFNKKIGVVFTDIENKFSAWYNGGGKKVIEDGAKKFVDFTTGIITDNLPKIVSVGVEVGKSLAIGMLQGLKDYSKENPEMAALTAFMLTPGPMQAKLAAAGIVGVAGPISNEIDRFSDDSKSFGEKMKDLKADTLRGDARVPYIGPFMDKLIFGPDGTHANGLAKVPFDGYKAILHKDERVLTAQENKQYNADNAPVYRGGGSGTGFSPTVNVTIKGGAGGGTSSTVSQIRAAVRQELEAQWRSMSRQIPRTREV